MAVAGGVNVDIGGRAYRPLLPGDSNPGRVRLSLGGVGRNIAHNMALLGLSVGMLTALGDDVYARQIETSCRALGIDLSASIQVSGEATSTYLYVADPSGDMAVAVSDMDIYQHLTPEVLSEREAWLKGARALVADANLPAESLAWLCRQADGPVFADPVSAAKAEKLRPVLARIHSLKPNRLEAEALTGVAVTDETSACRAVDALLDRGVGRVYLTLGADGVLAADRTGHIRLRSRGGQIVNTTGSGDAFMAALVWAALEGADLAGSARAGLAAAAVAMAGEETINPRMSPEELRRTMKTISITEETI